MIGRIGKIGQTRQQEIKEGKNAITYPPLYVVFDEIYSYTEADSSYTQTTSLFNNSSDGDELMWVGEDDIIPDDDLAEYKKDNPDEDIKQLKVGHHDRFITVCFTRQAAEDFIKRERHNLNNPRIWVAFIPWRNFELREIGVMFGDEN